MRNKSVALVIYGEPGSERNAITEEKYKKLAAYLTEKGFDVISVLYHDSIAEKLEYELINYNALLVWVNPVEQGNDRKRLDALLRTLTSKGCFVSCHPDTIIKLGTKEILFLTKDAEFGSDVKQYTYFEDFKNHFLQSGAVTGTRILKQYRGNGGSGVFKVDTKDFENKKIGVTEATRGDREEIMDIEDFYVLFKTYFNNNGMLIDQAWNPNIINGMVRCYLSSNTVAGFGYQEINAFYPLTNGIYKKPGQRFYFSEDCRLFHDLKTIMENKWVSALQQMAGIETNMLPLIWDADFFINKINTDNTSEKYSLCEINVSCVSPFPESAVPYISDKLKEVLNFS